MRQKDAPEALRDAYNYYFGAVFGWAENSNLESVTAVDPLTVDFKLKVTAEQLHHRADPAAAVRDPEPDGARGRRRGQPRPRRAPMRRAGERHGRHRPVHVQEWVPNDHVTIAKNADYWNAERIPHLDEVIFRPSPIRPPSSTRSRPVTSTSPRRSSRATSRRSPADPASRSSTAAVVQHGPARDEPQHKPFDNPEIRQAVAHALNRQAYSTRSSPGMPAG